jgi:hypothetical protein
VHSSSGLRLAIFSFHMTELRGAHHSRGIQPYIKHKVGFYVIFWIFIVFKPIIMDFGHYWEILGSF